MRFVPIHKSRDPMQQADQRIQDLSVVPFEHRSLCVRQSEMCGVAATVRENYRLSQMSLEEASRRTASLQNGSRRREKETTRAFLGCVSWCWWNVWFLNIIMQLHGCVNSRWSTLPEVQLCPPSPVPLHRGVLRRDGDHCWHRCRFINHHH